MDASSVKDFDNLSWNILMLMGGGLALGYAIQASSLLDIISSELANLVDGYSIWVVMLAFTILVLAVGTFISSTVAAIVVLPVSNPLLHTKFGPENIDAGGSRLWRTWERTQILTVLVCWCCLV